MRFFKAVHFSVKTGKYLSSEAEGKWELEYPIGTTVTGNTNPIFIFRSYRLANEYANERLNDGRILLIDIDHFVEPTEKEPSWTVASNKVLEHYWDSYYTEGQSMESIEEFLVNSWEGTLLTWQLRVLRVLPCI